MASRFSVGSGYHPSAWCKNCVAPFDVSLPACPECGHPNPAPITTSSVPAPTTATPVPGTCLDCGKPCETYICTPCQEERRL